MCDTHNIIPHKRETILCIFLILAAATTTIYLFLSLITNESSFYIYFITIIICWGFFSQKLYLIWLKIQLFKNDWCSGILIYHFIKYITCGINIIPFSKNQMNILYFCLFYEQFYSSSAVWTRNNIIFLL